MDGILPSFFQLYQGGQRDVEDKQQKYNVQSAGDDINHMYVGIFAFYNNVGKTHRQHFGKHDNRKQ